MKRLGELVAWLIPLAWTAAWVRAVWAFVVLLGQSPCRLIG